MPTPAEPPADQPKTLELPDLPDLKIPDRKENPQRDERIQRIIRDSLEQGSAAETGDPVLDDVLQVIKNRPSILQGSSLDPAVDQDSPKPDSTVSARAHAAECLLRAARVLERIDLADENRRELVNQMRRESVRLLTE